MAGDIRLGILGPGRIFRRVMTDMPNAKGIKITSVASRDKGRAAEAASLCGAEHIYTDYEALAASPFVDLIYIATPHVFHKEQAILCMEHGKHVICEKPMALNPEEIREMSACARKNNVFLMEAMWTRFFPAMTYVRDKLSSGIMGKVKHITCSFCYDASFAPDDSRVWNMDLAGGAILDVGIYDLAVISDILGPEPSSVQGVCRKWRTGCDAAFGVQMMYPSGATAYWYCACDVTTGSDLDIYCEKGQIHVPDFWHPTKVETIYYRSGREVREFPPENEGHHYEFVHAAECIREGMIGSPVMPVSESEKLSEIMTALRYENGIIYPQEKSRYA